jgi:molybdopterin/thiamine biosynthesis adenylyltransferase
MASYLDVQAHAVAVDAENLPALMAGCSAVADGLDSVPRKVMLEEAAANAGLPFVHGSVNREEGFAFIEAAGGRKLAAMWPDAGEGDEAFSASPDTVVSSAAGVACLMASLLVRALAQGEVRDSALLHLDCSVPELERFEF